MKISIRSWKEISANQILLCSCSQVLTDLCITSRGEEEEFEKGMTRSYVKDLSESYNNFFFKYGNSPLLIVNTTEIDFVNNDEDFEELYNQIFREDRGFIEYFNPGPRV